MEDKLIEILDKTKNANVWIITYKGSPIITHSGKCGWSTIGAAKTALRHHIRQYCDYDDYFQTWDYLFGLVEFVKISQKELTRPSSVVEYKGEQDANKTGE